MKKTHEVIIETLREEAQEKAEQLIHHKSPELQEAMRNVFVSGYVSGASSILQKELVDRIAEKAGEQRQKKAHKSGLKKRHVASHNKPKMRKV